MKNLVIGSAFALALMSCGAATDGNPNTDTTNFNNNEISNTKANTPTLGDTSKAPSEPGTRSSQEMQTGTGNTMNEEGTSYDTVTNNNRTVH